MLTMSPLFLMKVMDARSSSTLSNFDLAVYFSSLDSDVSFSSLIVLSLVTLSVFPNSVPIKVGNITSSLLTPESDQAPIHADKIQSASQRRS